MFVKIRCLHSAAFALGNLGCPVRYTERGGGFCPIMRILIVFMLVLAGCTTPPESEPPTYTIHEGVPAWQIGEQWRFRGEEDGINQVWTIKDRATKDGVPLVQMQMEWYHANGTYWTTALLVYDERQLEPVELQNGPFHDLYDCDDAGLFPMQSKTYTCTIIRNGQENQPLFFERTIGPAIDVVTPIGTFNATKVLNHNPTLNDGEGRDSSITWWSQEVGQVVQFWEQGDLFVLQDWTRPS